MSAELPAGLPFYAFAGMDEARAMLASGRVPAGLWGLRLRAPDAGDGLYLETAAALRALVDASFPSGAKPLLACDFRPALLDRLPADFWHVRVRDLGVPSFGGLSASARKDACLSAHSAADLELAAASGIGRAVLSPVFAPLSAKACAARPLGLETFAALTRGFPQIRIFALGGVCAERMGALGASGCFGCAGISLLRTLLPGAA